MADRQSGDQSQQPRDGGEQTGKGSAPDTHHHFMSDVLGHAKQLASKAKADGTAVINSAEQKAKEHHVGEAVKDAAHKATSQAEKHKGALPIVLTPIGGLVGAAAAAEAAQKNPTVRHAEQAAKQTVEQNAPKVVHAVEAKAPEVVDNVKEQGQKAVDGAKKLFGHLRHKE